MKVKSILLRALGIFAMALIVFIVGYKAVYAEKYYNGTYVNGVNISGMTVDEAKEALSSELDSLSFTVTDKNGDTYQYSLIDDFGMTYSLDEVLEEIKIELDEDNMLDLWFSDKDYQLNVFELDEDMTISCIKDSQYYKDGKEDKTTNAKSVFDDDSLSFVVKEEYQGTNIKAESFEETILDAINSGTFSLDLSTGDYYVHPSILSDDEGLASEIEALNSYLEAEITYEMPSTTVVCDVETYNEWLDYSDGEVVLDEDAMSDYVEDLSDQYDTYNKSRSFKTTAKGTITISGGSLGCLTDVDGEVDELKDNILNQEVVSRTPVYSQEEAENNGVGYSYVEVDISNQMVYLYKNGSLIISTSCVTGNSSKGYDTPTGVYHVSYKQSPATLRGQYDSSTGTYEYESDVTYWMPFNGGVGLHDATWRSSFGGTIYKTNGSHGCVNLPYSAAKTIYSNITSGYLVIVY